MRTPVTVALLAITLSSTAKSQLVIPPCPAPWATLVSDRVFSHYPVKTVAPRKLPAVPDVRIGQAHFYRTAIRQAAKNGPDFAGHYVIVQIGCGAATACLAIADTLTGRVFFPPKLGAATALLVDTPDDEKFSTLNYRRSSRLLILVGTPNEDPNTEGMSYYVWRANRLRLVRFIPTTKLCSMPLSATRRSNAR